MATRKKMPVSERAKQFMPFSPLDGLNKALRKKEEEFGRTMYERSDASNEELDYQLSLLEEKLARQKITDAQISFIREGREMTLNTSITRIDKDKATLELKEGELALNEIIGIIQ